MQINTTVDGLQLWWEVVSRSLSTLLSALIAARGELEGYNYRTSE